MDKSSRAKVHLVRCDVIAAENLPPKAITFATGQIRKANGSSDKSSKQRTKVIKSSGDPVWNEQFNFSLLNLESEALVFKLHDKSKSQDHGEVVVSLLELFPEGPTTSAQTKDLKYDYIEFAMHQFSKSSGVYIHLRVTLFPPPDATQSAATGSSPPTISLPPDSPTSNGASSNSSPTAATHGPASAELTPNRGGTTKARSLSNAATLNSYKEHLAENDPQKLAPMSKIKNPRELVSLQKKRFKDDKWNLDLAYITDRVIAMGFPSSGMEKYYRNSMEDTQDFLNFYHPQSHKVYNLCSEREYPDDKFYRQARYPFDDHNVPTLEQLAAFCKDLDEWLDESEANIAAIHCKAGKGRTGLVITAFLPYRYDGKIDIETSLQFYAERRTMNAKGVTIPSQVRFVRYFSTLVNPIKLEKPIDLHRPRTIEKITIDFPPSPFANNFIVTNHGNKFISKDHDPVVKYKDVVSLSFDLRNMEVNKEVKVEFLDEKEKSKSFFFWFHTYFVKENTFTLRYSDLDKPKPKGGYDSRFNLIVHFVPEPESEPEEVADAVPVVAASTSSSKTTSSSHSKSSKSSSKRSKHSKSSKSKTSSSPAIPEVTVSSPPSSASLPVSEEHDSSPPSSPPSSSSIPDVVAQESSPAEPSSDAQQSDHSEPESDSSSDDSES